MGLFLADVFKQYNWKRVVVISSNYFLWLDAGKGIRKVSIPHLSLPVSQAILVTLSEGIQNTELVMH